MVLLLPWPALQGPLQGPGFFLRERVAIMRHIMRIGKNFGFITAVSGGGAVPEDAAAGAGAAPGSSPAGVRSASHARSVPGTPTRGGQPTPRGQSPRGQSPAANRRSTNAV